MNQEALNRAITQITSLFRQPTFTRESFAQVLAQYAADDHFSHWRRTTAASSFLIHDVDCEFYHKHHLLCTCGLLHALKRCPDKAPALYPEYAAEISDHNQALEFLG